MKNFTLFVLLAFVVSADYAQTINESAFPGAGDVFTLSLADTTGFNTGATGANQTWNFSSLSANGATLVDSFMSPSSTPYGALVPSATIAVHEISTISQYIYYQDNTGQSVFQRVANIQPDTVLYSTPSPEYPYPLALNTALSGNYYAQYGAHGHVATEAGTVSGSADATGTLTTPTGTYQNVIRIHGVRSELDTIVIPGTGTYTGTTTQEVYNWYQPQSYYPILQYAVVDQVISPFISNHKKTLGYRAGTLANAINNVSGTNNAWVIYPNPAAGQATVIFDAPQTGKTEITLLDMAGRQIQSVTDAGGVAGLQTVNLNLQNITSGIYLVVVKNEAGISTTKLQVSK